MTLKEQFQELFNKIKPIVRPILSRYTIMGVFLLFMLIYSALVLRINHLSSKEPSDSQVSSELKTIPRPKVDPATLAKIQQLQDQNIQVKALFDQARQNPFAE
ncbi:MAG TPA: hypothetical protein VLH86_02245 [Patescibacteria group bacterium]|nr:hypothetical protein [Patescibacteria group bacterium]